MWDVEGQVASDAGSLQELHTPLGVGMTNGQHGKGGGKIQREHASTLAGTQLKGAEQVCGMWGVRLQVMQAHCLT